VTCCEGRIDLNDFTKRLLLFIGQKGNNDFLLEHSAKTVRGKLANAKKGGRNGGRAIYGLDRGLFSDVTGALVRRLLPGEYVHLADHRVRLLPSTDTVRVQAVRYAFTRFDAADLAVRDLAREMAAKGWPSPTEKGWTGATVGKLLRTRAYGQSARTADQSSA
jgi:hypothetical protein